MKTFTLVVKILTAIAAVAGAIYLCATYGEQIVAWAKKALESMPKCPYKKEEKSAEETAPASEEPAPAEESPAAVETPAEEAPAEETPAAEEAPAEEPAPIVITGNEPVADEADFAE